MPAFLRDRQVEMLVLTGLNMRNSKREIPAWLPRKQISFGSAAACPSPPTQQGPSPAISRRIWGGTGLYPTHSYSHTPAARNGEPAWPFSRHEDLVGCSGTGDSRLFID